MNESERVNGAGIELQTGHQHQHIQPPVSCLLPVLALPVVVALMTRLIQLTSPRTKVFIVPERRAD